MPLSFLVFSAIIFGVSCWPNFTFLFCSFCCCCFCYRFLRFLFLCQVFVQFCWYSVPDSKCIIKGIGFLTEVDYIAEQTSLHGSILSQSPWSIFSLTMLWKLNEIKQKAQIPVSALLQFHHIVSHPARRGGRSCFLTIQMFFQLTDERELRRRTLLGRDRRYFDWQAERPAIPNPSGLLFYLGWPQIISARTPTEKGDFAGDVTQNPARHENRGNRIEFVHQSWFSKAA